MAHRDTSVSELCREFGIRPVTLYRYVGPQADIDEELVDQAKLTAWLAVGGGRIGLGDWRPEKSGVFGRFDVESVTELAAPAVKPSGRSFGGTRRRPAATRRECAMTETDAEKALYRTLATRCNVRLDVRPGMARPPAPGSAMEGPPAADERRDLRVPIPASRGGKLSGKWTQTALC